MISFSDSKSRYSFIAFFIMLLGFVLFTFMDYGISWNEPVQDEYGHNVLDYYLSGMQNQSFLRLFNLYYYGAFFDVIAVSLQKILPFEWYETRHLFNAFTGIAGIYGCGLLAYYLAGNVTAFFLAMIVLFLVPSYTGHMFINPKDIPFAAAYIWSLYFLLKSLERFPRIKIKETVFFGICSGVAVSCRAGGFLLGFYAFIYLLFFAVPMFRKNSKKNRKILFSSVLLFSVASFLCAFSVTLIFWPWLHFSTVSHVFEALSVFSNFPWSQGWDVPLNGTIYKTEALPWFYVPFMLGVKLPEGLLLLTSVLFSCSVFLIIKRRKNLNKKKFFAYLLVAFSVVFPVFYAVIKGSSLHGGIRHFLFVIPPLVSLTGAAYGFFIKKVNRYTAIAIHGICAVYGAYMLFMIVTLHPYQYVYFNHLTGGVKQASTKYHFDYWAVSYKEAVEKLQQFIKDNNYPADYQYKVGVCHAYKSAEPFFPDNFKIEKNPNIADFYIGFTGMNCPWPYGNEIALVTRKESILSKVIMVRKGNAF